MKNNAVFNRKAIIGLILFFFSGLIREACNNDETRIRNPSVVEHEYIQKLQKDSLIIAYNKIERQLTLGIAAGKFNLSHTDNKMIDKNRKSCKMPAQLIALYKKAGITHAKELKS